MKPKTRPSAEVEVLPRRTQIYLAASKLFVEKGFDGTSMSDIAAAVKITKAGLYHFVESKEDLLNVIVSFGMDELHRDVIVPAREVDDPLDRLKLIIGNHLENVGRVSTDAGNPMTIISDETSGLSEANRLVIERRKREYFDFVRATLDALKADGRLATGINTTVATFSLLGMILWMARWRRPDGPLGLEEIISQITAMALGGLIRD